ncbi:hypothetical protein ACYOEI_00150 [Singulisphaera rosea]
MHDLDATGGKWELIQAEPADVDLTGELDLPSGRWTVEHLGSYIQTHLNMGAFFARKTAQQLWLVGRALNLINAKLKKSGGWTKWAQAQDVSLPTMYACMKIAETFSSLDDLQGIDGATAKVIAGVARKPSKVAAPEVTIEQAQAPTKTEEPPALSHFEGTVLEETEQEEEVEPDHKGSSRGERRTTKPEPRLEVDPETTETRLLQVVRLLEEIKDGTPLGETDEDLLAEIESHLDRLRDTAKSSTDILPTATLPTFSAVAV